MAKFDPYRIWLGIPPQEQPANHYRLLGIGLFESDPDVISNAADRQMVHLRSFQSGKRSELSQQILNELSAARVCLLDTQKKVQYDAQLRAKLAAEKPETPVPVYPVLPPPGSSAPPPPRSSMPPPPRSSTPPPPRIGGSAPPVFSAAAAPQVRTGGSASQRTTAADSYSLRRKKSTWQIPAIAILAALGLLALLFWALNNTESQHSREPNAASSEHADNELAARQPSDGLQDGLDGNGHRPTRSKLPSYDDRFNEDATDTENPPNDSEDSNPQLPDFHLPPSTDSDQPPGQPSLSEFVEEEPAEIPDETSLDDAIEQVMQHDLFQADFASNDPLTISTLIENLREESRNPRNDSAKRFAMLRLALDKATETGNTRTALSVVEEIGEKFEYDVADNKRSTLETLSGKTTTSAGATHLVCEMLAAADEIDAPQWFREQASPLASMVREGTLFQGEFANSIERLAGRIEARAGEPAPENAPALADDPIFGVNEDSERAVDKALQWLADQQTPAGYWSFGTAGAPMRARTPGNPPSKHPDDTIAATALALLPFLAAGNDQQRGDFSSEVDLGLRFLQVRLQGVPGMPGAAAFLDLKTQHMPTHALATLALCEACGRDRSKNSRIRGSAQQAANYIAQTQNAKDGGWGYRPPLPSNVLATAWNVAALKAGEWAGVKVSQKNQNVYRDARRYLEKMRFADSCEYRLEEGRTSADPTATAAATLAQMYLGPPHDEPTLEKYVTSLSNVRLKLSPVARFPICQMYHAGQVMRHYGGSEWDQWNSGLRNALVESREPGGSWLFRSSSEPITTQGGRLFCTAMATLMLEVYYRHPPFYR